MTSYDVKRLALVLALQADIEGMKAENQARLIKNEAPVYPDGEFIMKADELREIAYRPEELL